MRYIQSIFLVLPLLQSFLVVNGYMIDTVSCTGDDLTFVRAALTQAFDMSDRAYQAANTRPLSDYVKSLCGWLLNRATTRNGEFDNQNDAAAIFATAFQGINSMSVEVTDTDTLIHNAGDNGHEVKIFCDAKRFSVSSDGSQWNDQDSNSAVWDATTDKAVTSDPGAGCRQKILDKGVTDPVFMLTTNTQEGKYDQITICPWFLDYITKKDRKTMKDIESKNWVTLARVLPIQSVVTFFKYTPIDNVSLFDKVMLHELMHTKAGGNKIDVGERDGYGWKNCKKIGITQTIPTIEQFGGVSNADTFALFGSAVWISENENLFVNEDGKLVKPSDWKPWKLS